MGEAIPTKISPAASVAAGTVAGTFPNAAPFMRGGEPIFIDRNSSTGILMLHGFTSTPHQFREMSQYLADHGYTVFAPVVAGHGTSPRELAKTTVADWQQSVEEAFQFFRGKVKRIFCIGNSFGGNLAFWLAHRHPEAFSGIVSLGTPITLRWQRFINFRLRTYGKFKTYYRKLGRDYEIDYIDLADQVSYPVIPIASLRQFLHFIRAITLPTLHTVTVPTLMIQADRDPVVHPKSVQYIHEHLGSDYKKVYWLSGRYHNLPDSNRRGEIFHKVIEFIEDLALQP
ncbi:MAG: alpha/beta fold hydrolase [Patescibacteria group bacterium]|nr:alpha/beta fold hydrolase [Patescibacteria group bacterium]